MTDRQIKISELRAEWAIKQTQANQLLAAINVLLDQGIKDDEALKVSTDICRANIGP